MKSFKQHLNEKCWDGYTQRGMKKKGDRMVPNCVPEEASGTTCGCDETCKHCGGQHPESEIGKTCDCCGNMIQATIGEGSETWEAGYKRRVVKTTKPEHKEKGHNWRIKGKDRPEISIKLYKEKPSQAEFNKQMKRVAGHEFGG